MRKSVVLLSVLLTFSSLPTTARADPLTLNGLSHLALDFEGDFFRFAGSSFDLRGRTEFNVSIPRVHTPSCNPCFRGDLVNLSFRTTGDVDLGAGPGVISGREFPLLTFRGSLEFLAAPVVVPLVPFDPTDPIGAFTISAPFRFRGFVRAFAGEDEVFGHALRGMGAASHSYVLGEGGGPPYTVAEDATRYAFDEATPVPEPSTMLLVGLGTLALSRVRRSGRSRPREL